MSEEESHPDRADRGASSARLRRIATIKESLFEFNFSGGNNLRNFKNPQIFFLTFFLPLV